MPSQVEGVRQLERVFKQLPKKLRDKALMSALRAGATVQRKEMKAKAPVDDGNLRNNIVTRRIKGRFALMTGPSRKAFYGSFLEFGTSKISPRGYMRSSFDSSLSVVQTRVLKQLVKAVVREAGKLRGPLRKSGLLSRRGFIKRSGL